MTFMGSEATHRPVTAEVSTSGYRITGTLRTRFDRIADVLNNLDRTHLTLELATVRELVDPGRGERAESVMVPVDEILFLVADMPSDRTHDAIVVPKRPVAARLAMPPFRLSGAIYVPDSVESVATAITMTPDVFVPMVDATVTCWIRPELSTSYPVVAFQRRLVHVMSFDEATDPLGGLRPTQPADSGWS